MHVFLRGVMVCLVLGAVLSAAGCMHVTIGPMSVGAPVLMGPIERIGDREPRRARAEDTIPFKGKVGVTAVGSGGTSQHVSGSSVVTTTQSYSGSMRDDTLSDALRQARQAAGGGAQSVVYIDDFRAQAWMHSYVFLFAGGVTVKVARVVTKVGGAAR